MKRLALNELLAWKQRKNRKPLLLRGARQVGKTHLVREFSNEFEQLIEINLDQKISYRDLFESSEPAKIIILLEATFEKEIKPGKTLIFIDEIQACPQAIHCLRYFYEMMPDLHIIAAGSLLEFVLSDHEFSMPVGRIEYLYLGPMTFEEFLLAKEKTRLLQFIKNFNFKMGLDPSVHEMLLEQIKEYLFIGGMPAVVEQYLDAGFEGADREKQSLLSTYIDDFGKYRKQVPSERMQMVFSKLPSQVCEKLKYVNISKEEKSKSISDCIHLFELANIVYLVKHSNCSGLPLGAHVNHKQSKVLFLDVGLLAYAVGLSYLDFKTENLLASYNGKAVEQFIGQHLLQRNEYWKKPELYYWKRENKNSSAELDYVLQHKGEIIPVEVKAGKKGTLLSLKLFLSEKKASLSVRFNCNQPVLESFVDKKMISLPIYMVGELNRIIDDEMNRS